MSEDPRDVLDPRLFKRRGPVRATRAPTAPNEFGRSNAIPGELVVRVRPTKVITGFDISD